MDDACYVGRMHRVGKNPNKTGRLAGLNPARGEHLVQAFAVHVLQGQIGERARLTRYHQFPDSEDLNNVGVLDASDCLGLDAEAIEMPRGSQPAVEHFQGHQSLEPLVTGPVNGPQAPFTEPRDQFVPGHLDARGGRRIGHTSLFGLTPPVRERTRQCGHCLQGLDPSL